MFKKYSWVIFLCVAYSGTVVAQEPVYLSGTTIQNMQLTQAKRSRFLLSTDALALRKRIALLKFKLSAETKKSLIQRMHGMSKAGAAAGYFPRSIQLGMNDVPVLDQGEHGTCTLFSSTAAINAAMGKGDYISQLCHLDLSHYLNQNGYAQSQWNTGWVQDVLAQITMFGVVPKSVQTSGGCSGRLDYPLQGSDLSDEISVFDFHQISEPIQDYGISFVPVILKEQINTNLINRDHVLVHIKHILKQGERVLCSTLLMGQVPGDDTPSGSHHMTNDSWVLLPQMAEDLNGADEATGHAFVITGYDDDAIAVDATGKFHRGLLTLRSSWGADVGDHGDFYMSYAYFKAALLEAHQVTQS